MPDPRVVAGALLAGVIGVLIFGYVIVPAARQAAIENASAAGNALAWSVDIFFPVGLGVALMTRRGLNAPVLGNRMISIASFCVGGVVALYLDTQFFVPATARAFTHSLVNFIGPSSWLTPFAYWLVWPIIALVAVTSFGLAAGFSARSVLGSFGRRAF